MAGGRILFCKDCQALVMVIKPGTGEITCDGKPMEALTANSTDAAQEKHVPVVKVDGNKITVTVGSVAHPMTEAHLIEWIYLQTKHGGQYKHLSHEDKPEATFIVAEGDEPVAVYEHCNLHGLWKTDI